MKPSGELSRVIIRLIQKGEWKYFEEHFLGIREVEIRAMLKNGVNNEEPDKDFRSNRGAIKVVDSLMRLGRDANIILKKNSSDDEFRDMREAHKQNEL